ncbi:septin-12-like, partial [Egretta garzetta]|uniref:septin-12-like n=1 Tax=Egretta garzetta TaxID=188379 RepID=UPI00163D2947
MKLTVTDTPGFGDQINNENCWDPIIKYINEQYERYLREEILIMRKRKIPDTRVHGCVYFIPPTGHWLRPLDLEFMRRLSKIVNVVPVIAKADTLTLEERAEFKQRIQEDLKTHAISVYPQEDFDQDPDDRVLNDRIRAAWVGELARTMAMVTVNLRALTSWVGIARLFAVVLSCLAFSLVAST